MFTDPNFYLFLLLGLIVGVPCFWFGRFRGQIETEIRLLRDRPGASPEAPITAAPIIAGPPAELCPVCGLRHAPGAPVRDAKGNVLCMGAGAQKINQEQIQAHLARFEAGRWRVCVEWNAPRGLESAEYDNKAAALLARDLLQSRNPKRVWIEPLGPATDQGPPNPGRPFTR